jgi:hypothetical protein
VQDTAPSVSHLMTGNASLDRVPHGAAGDRVTMRRTSLGGETKSETSHKVQIQFLDNLSESGNPGDSAVVTIPWRGDVVTDSGTPTLDCGGVHARRATARAATVTRAVQKKPFPDNHACWRSDSSVSSQSQTPLLERTLNQKTVEEAEFELGGLGYARTAEGQQPSAFESNFWFDLPKISLCTLGLGLGYRVSLLFISLSVPFALHHSAAPMPHCAPRFPHGRHAQSQATYANVDICHAQTNQWSTALMPLPSTTRVTS